MFSKTHHTVQITLAKRNSSKLKQTNRISICTAIINNAMTIFMATERWYLVRSWQSFGPTMINHRDHRAVGGLLHEHAHINKKCLWPANTESADTITCEDTHLGIGNLCNCARQVFSDDWWKRLVVVRWWLFHLPWSTTTANRIRHFCTSKQTQHKKSFLSKELASYRAEHIPVQLIPFTS